MSHERQSPDKKTEEARAFLEALKTGDLDAVRRMIQGNRNLLFITDDYYGSPVRAATDTHPEIADFLARIELRRLGEGSVPEDELYGGLEFLGEAARSETGYRGCESLRAEAEPVVAGYL